MGNPRNQVRPPQACSPAFLISAFAARQAALILETLSAACASLPKRLEEHRFTPGGRALLHGLTLLRADEDKQDDVLPSILMSIQRAPFVVADLTPAHSTQLRGTSWNANVFYELAYADARRVPVFRVIDAQLQPGRRKADSAFEALPFDIRNRKCVPYGDLTIPAERAKLVNAFVAWATDDAIFQHVVRRIRIADAYQAFLDIVEQALAHQAWDSNRWHYYAIVESYLDRMQSITATLNDISKNIDIDLSQGSGFLVQKLYTRLISRLGPGDQYWTVSTFAFWSCLLTEGSEFFEANRQALARGVLIKRLFLCRPDVSKQETAERRRLFNDHLALAKEYPGRYLVRHTRSPDPRNDDRHCGVFVRDVSTAHRSAAAFKPRYGPHGDLSGIEILRAPDKALARVKALWAEVPPRSRAALE